jgi:hypothetical protein
MAAYGGAGRGRAAPDLLLYHGQDALSRGGPARSAPVRECGEARACAVCRPVSRHAALTGRPSDCIAPASLLAQECELAGGGARGHATSRRRGTPGRSMPLAAAVSRLESHRRQSHQDGVRETAPAPAAAVPRAANAGGRESLGICCSSRRSGVDNRGGRRLALKGRSGRGSASVVEHSRGSAPSADGAGRRGTASGPAGPGHGGGAVADGGRAGPRLTRDFTSQQNAGPPARQARRGLRPGARPRLRLECLSGVFRSAAFAGRRSGERRVCAFRRTGARRRQWGKPTTLVQHQGGVRW